MNVIRNQRRLSKQLEQHVVCGINMRSILLSLLAVLAFATLVLARVSEDERVRLWHQNGNTWPPKWPSNESPERQYRMSLRDRELQLIPGTNERWENYVQYTQSRLVPRFTEVGFKVVPIPPTIFQKLKEQVDAGIANWDNLRLERQIDAVFTPLPSKFVDMHAVNQEVIQELQSMHEEWAGGIQLRATSAYGTRLYQNGSSLVMHHDKVFICSHYVPYLSSSNVFVKRWLFITLHNVLCLTL